MPFICNKDFQKEKDTAAKAVSCVLIGGKEQPVEQPQRPGTGTQMLGAAIEIAVEHSQFLGRNGMLAEFGLLRQLAQRLRGILTAKLC